MSRSPNGLARGALIVGHGPPVTQLARTANAVSRHFAVLVAIAAAVVMARSVASVWFPA